MAADVVVVGALSIYKLDERVCLRRVWNPIVQRKLVLYVLSPHSLSHPVQVCVPLHWLLIMSAVAWSHL